MSAVRHADVEAFCNRVDEVCQLVDGLKDESVNPETVESLVQNTTRSCARCRDAGIKALTQDQQERVALTQALKKRQLEKHKRRKQYAAYVESQDDNSEAQRRCQTDYRRWELWCPSDEEDALIQSCTPCGAEFKALERDAKERHQSSVRMRQVAERRRVEGNEAYRKGQFHEAYRLYCEGVVMEKHNLALHCNAAMACIRMESYSLAIEHCDKVVEIACGLLQKPKHPLCLKALQRRSLAHRRLGHVDEAILDLERFLEADPVNKEIQEEMESLRERKELLKKSQNVETLEGLDASREQIMHLREILERLPQALDARDSPDILGMTTLLPKKHRTGAAINSMLKELSELLQSDVCRMVFRQSNGLSLVSKLLSCIGIQVSLVFEVLDRACLDRLLMDGFIHSHAILEQVINKIEEGLLKDSAWLLCAFKVLLCIARDADGKKKLIMALRSSPSDPLAELVKAACSLKTKDTTKLDLIRVLNELFICPSAQRALVDRADVFSTLMSFATAMHVAILQEEGPSTAFILVNQFLITLSSSHLLRKQMMNTSGFMQRLAQTMQHRLSVDDQDGLYVTVALFANCLIDNDSNCGWVKNALTIIITPLRDILISNKCQRRIKSAAIVALSRIAVHESILQVIDSIEMVEAISKLLTETRYAHSKEATELQKRIQDSAFGVLARLSSHRPSSIQLMVDHGVINTAKELLKKTQDDHKAAGNVLLLFSNIAQDIMHREQLSDESLLLKIIHIASKRKGEISKNAAICLARLAQKPKILDFIRSHHGIEILHCVLSQAPCN